MDRYSLNRVKLHEGISITITASPRKEFLGNATYNRAIVRYYFGVSYF